MWHTASCAGNTKGREIWFESPHENGVWLTLDAIKALREALIYNGGDVIVDGKRM